MKKIIAYLCVVACAFSMPSCVDSGSLLPSVTGTSYEVLVVMNTPYWKGKSGDKLREYVAADMQQVPQIEPLFTISQTNFNGFSSILKPVRNIILADIDSTKYTQNKVYYMKNQWAKPQAVVRICTPNQAEFLKTVDAYGKNIANYLVKNEIERQKIFYEGYTNRKIKDELFQKFGISINIPNDIAQMTHTDDFYWITDNKTNVRRDIVIYSYPYTDKNTFTKEFLLAKRDSVMKKYLPGGVENSYMGTEYKHIPPVMHAVEVNGNYCAEVRGLWRMVNGEAMGGPFISHTRLDEMNQRIITAEVFVYAPGQKKRNPLRQLEAVLHSLKMPAEVNALQELVVSSETKKEEK